MNKNAVIGLTLIAAAGVLTCVLVSTDNGIAEGLIGKAVWYAPYVALVCGIRKLVSVR